MKRDRGKPRRSVNDAAPGLNGQPTIEMLIDEIGAQSFPASDPPAWGVVTARLARAVDGPDKHNPPAGEP
jgi:hypothetical protein